MSVGAIENMNLKTIILAAILLGVLLVGPVAAQVCQPGEVWQMITPGHFEWGSCNGCPSHQECDSVAYWKFHGFRNLGACVSDCQHNGGHGNYCEQLCKGTVETDCHTEYTCHHGQDYQSCGENQEQHRHWVDPIYGCVAVSCPAIPCDEGYSCIEGQCVQNPDPICGVDFFCDEGYHCSENQCVPNICGVDFQCETGYQCEDNQCVPVPRPSSNGILPYSELACQAIVNSQRPMDDIDPSTLKVLPLKNTYVSAAFRYASEFDCVDLAYYTRGEPSFDKGCIAAEWWNRIQTEQHTYGGMPVLTAQDPAQAICVLAVKNSPGETTLPVTITLTDSHGNVGDTIVSSDPVIRQCYQLPEDFSECRVR
jgi:hypothetical protein